MLYKGLKYKAVKTKCCNCSSAISPISPTTKWSAVKKERISVVLMVYGVFSFFNHTTGGHDSHLSLQVEQKIARPLMKDGN